MAETGRQLNTCFNTWLLRHTAGQRLLLVTGSNLVTYQVNVHPVAHHNRVSERMVTLQEGQLGGISIRHHVGKIVYGGDLMPS